MAFHITKSDILKEFEGDDLLLSYLPDDISKSSLNREYLLSVSIYPKFYVLSVVRKEKWLKLYQGYKELIRKKEYASWENYTITLSSETIEKIKAFVPAGM